ncbi:MAG: hypothetical protein IJ584_16695 [Bacteroidales bacterium]|nr:hypothetical protein [Bacteroidales bacterium]
MTIEFFVTDTKTGDRVVVNVEPASVADYKATKDENWQTPWTSSYIQNPEFQKYAFRVESTNELIGLGAYRYSPRDYGVYVEYIESSPANNPTMAAEKRYSGLGAVLLAFGVQLSYDNNCDGSIVFKAKTTELLKHYIQDYHAIQYSSFDPYLLLMDYKLAYDLIATFSVDEEEEE